MKTNKALKYALASILTATMLGASIPVNAALPVTGYNRTATHEDTGYHVNASYNYSNFSVNESEDSETLYQYALKPMDSFTFTYRNNQIGSGNIEVFTLDGTTSSDGLIIEGDSSPKRITAVTQGTYRVKFNNSNNTAASYLYVVVVPESGSYDLELPNIYDMYRESSAFGYQLLLQPLAVDDVVTLKMYAPSSRYTTENSVFFDVDPVGTYVSESTDISVVELDIKGEYSQEVDTAKQVPIEEGFCDAATITAIGKGYAIARLRYGPRYNKADGTFNIEIPVEYRLPTLKKAIVSSAQVGGVKYSSINGGRSVAHENAYKNDLISVGALAGSSDRVKEESSYVTVGKDVGQEDNFIVYQYDEPVLLRDLTSVFGTYSEAQFPDAVRIEIAETDYDLPVNELYVGPKGFAGNTGTAGKPADMTAIYLPNNTDFLKSCVETANVTWMKLIEGSRLDITINGETKPIKDYNYDKGMVWVEGSFSELPVAGSQYSITAVLDSRAQTKTMSASEYPSLDFGEYAESMSIVNQTPATETLIPIKGLGQKAANLYVGYYLTIGEETRRITFSMNDIYIVDSPFSNTPSNDESCTVTADDPTRGLVLPRDAVAVQLFSTGNGGLSDGGLPQMSGCYMTIGDERKQIITSGSSSVYVEKFDDAVEGQTYSFDMEGYRKGIGDDTKLVAGTLTGGAPFSESVLRENVYRLLKDGDQELKWKVVYEDGFEDVISEEGRGTDERFAKFTVTWDMIKDYLSKNGDTAANLKPTSLIKITAIGVKDDEGERVYDPTKKINFLETYVNAKDPADIPTENAIIPVLEENILKAVKVASLDVSQKDAVLIVSQYNEFGKMINADLFKVDIQLLDTVMVNTDNIDLTHVHSCKILLWNVSDSIDVLKPMFDMVKLPEDDADDEE